MRTPLVSWDVSTLWQRLVEWQQLCFPPECLLCREALGPPVEESSLESIDGFCEACAGSLELKPQPVCPRCAATVGPHLEHQPRCAVCRDESFAFDRVLRLAPYRTGLKRIVRACKRGERPELLVRLADLWIERNEALLRTESIALVTSVPASRWSQLVHWSNHAETLAERIASSLHLPCEPGLLRKVRRTRRQATLFPSERRKNVRDAWRADRRIDLGGVNVLLVDDVVTTGATANECAKQLKSIHAGRVIVAAMARGLGQRGVTETSNAAS